MKRIILASSSRSRREILHQVGLKFDVVPSEYVEDNTLPLAPAELVAHLALGKAQWVAERNPNAVTIGADTLMAIDGQVIGKQTDKDQLVATLTTLSGRSHSAFTGFAIIEGDHVVSGSLETKVFFRELSTAEIERYIDHTDEWRNRAAGYGIQGLGGIFVERIEGDYSNVVGLPLCQLALRLKEFDINILE